MDGFDCGGRYFINPHFRVRNLDKISKVKPLIIDSFSFLKNKKMISKQKHEAARKVRKLLIMLILPAILL
jgi:hypothetical protein